MSFLDTGGILLLEHVIAFSFNDLYIIKGSLGAPKSFLNPNLGRIHPYIVPTFFVFSFVCPFSLHCYFHTAY